MLNRNSEQSKKIKKGNSGLGGIGERSKNKEKNSRSKTFKEEGIGDSKIAKSRQGVNNSINSENKEKKKLDLNSVFRDIKNINWHGIRLKLILGFIVPVIMMIILGFISYDKASKGIIGNYENAVKDTLFATNDYFTLAFKSIEATASQISFDDNILDIQEFKPYKSINKNIVAKKAADDLMSDIHVFNKQDVIMSTKVSYWPFRGVYDDWVASEEMAAFNDESIDSVWIGEHPHLDEKFKMNKDEYGISYIKRATDAEGFSGKGKTMGYVVLDINKSIIENVISGFQWGENCYSAFITSDGREIATIPKGGSEKQTEEQDEGAKKNNSEALENVPENIFLEQEFYKAALESNENTGVEYVTYNGKSHLFLYSKIAKNGSIVCGLIPRSNITSQADGIKTITIRFVIIATIIAIIICTVLASGISNIINKIIKSLTSAASGDFTHELNVKKRRDEFGVLSKCVNSMIKSIKGLIEEVRVISNQVTVSNADVENSSEILYRESKEILNAINEVEEGIVKQAEDAESCLERMSSLSDKINIVYSNANSIEETTSKTKSVSQEGKLMIRDLTGKTKETANITDIIINDIQALDEESRDIRSIVGTINEIAEQTNLLSLNAYIEAARAGEAGKGFAVVADEIRKLADQSVGAVVKIQQIVDIIQGRTAVIVKSAKQAENIVKDQETSLEKTVETFSIINSSIEGLVSTLNSIVSGMKDMERTKDDTLGAMESISSVSQQTAAVSKEIAISTAKQLEAVEKLNTTTNELSKDVKGLNESVSIFKI